MMNVFEQVASGAAATARAAAPAGTGELVGIVFEFCSNKDQLDANQSDMSEQEEGSDGLFFFPQSSIPRTANDRANILTRTMCSLHVHLSTSPPNMNMCTKLFSDINSNFQRCLGHSSTHPCCLSSAVHILKGLHLLLQNVTYANQFARLLATMDDFVEGTQIT